jgi:hypothetical protein
MSRPKSWLFLHLVYPDVRRLEKAKDSQGLLRLLEESADADRPGSFSKTAAIVTMLGELRAADAVPFLAPLVKDHDHVDIRVSAIIALSRIGGFEASIALHPALDDELYAAKRAAVEGVSTDDPDVRADLIALAKHDPQPMIRATALEALGRTKEDHWIPLFSEAATTDTQIPALAALTALATLRTPASDGAIRGLRRTSEGRLIRVCIVYARIYLTVSPRARQRRKRAAHPGTAGNNPRLPVGSTTSRRGHGLRSPPTSRVAFQSLSPALAGITGAVRAWIVLMISVVSMPCRYVLVTPRWACPSWRWMTGSGIPSRAISTA